MKNVKTRTEGHVLRKKKGQMENYEKERHARFLCFFSQLFTTTCVRAERRLTENEKPFSVFVSLNPVSTWT